MFLNKMCPALTGISFKIFGDDGECNTDFFIPDGGINILLEIDNSFTRKCKAKVMLEKFIEEFHIFPKVQSYYDQHGQKQITSFNSFTVPLNTDYYFSWSFVFDHSLGTCTEKHATIYKWDHYTGGYRRISDYEYE